jgi:hypothetical protein
MKKLLLLAALFTSITFSTKANEGKELLVGSWKYSTQSSVNDFQKITNTVSKDDYSTEYFIFEKNNKFRHEFINKDAEIVRSLKGKWKLVNNKIKIEYVEPNYSLTLDYFFLDQDLVLGQNFNHIIFSKDDVLDPNEKNIASIK